MKFQSRWFLATAMLSLALLVVTSAYGDGEETTYRWDIINVDSFSPVTIDPGGQASALSNDCVTVMSVTTCAKITVTGSGTFTVGDPDDVTGGGNWQTFDHSGASTGTGTYLVKRLIRFTVAPGTQTVGVVDHIGNGTLTDDRGGLAYLQIKYFDNLGNPIPGPSGKGVLEVSCHIPGNPPPQGPDASPPSVFEGITASKGFVGYWNRVAPVGGVDGNRTLFHILPED